MLDLVSEDRYSQKFIRKLIWEKTKMLDLLKEKKLHWPPMVSNIMYARK
jgi:hypothetical protein